MPEYGIGEKSPEDLALERAKKESNERLIATFKAAEAVEREDRRRKVESESSSIETAKLLVELNNKIDQEHKDRLVSEEKAENQRMLEAKISRFRFIVGTVIGLLTLAATLYPFVRPYLFLG